MPKDQTERVKSSLILRLNGKLFLRLLGIFFWLDLILALLLAGGFVLWAEDTCTQVAALVDERGVPSQEATLWMDAGDYRVEALDRPAQGQLVLDDGIARSLLPPAVYQQERTAASGAAYAIRLDASDQLRLLRVGAAVLGGFQLLALVFSLFRNAGILSRALRPIQELAAAAAKLSNVSALSVQELEELADKLDDINSSHLDQRITMTGARQEVAALTEAINAMLERIHRAYRSQARFVSDASHELRTPIAVIRGYADMLDRWGKNDPAALQEGITAIKSEAASMQELVEQLLFLARGDNNTTPLHPEPFDLTAIASVLLKEARMIDGKHTFEGRWEGAIPIVADPALIKQAGRVLMDNAVKYSPNGGRILVAVGLRDGMAALSVEDEGQGIAPADLPHVFERFYRTDRSRARQTGGTGLGLSIAQWIVERHGGRFEVVSREDVGTRFTMLLPAGGSETSGA